MNYNMTKDYIGGRVRSRENYHVDYKRENESMDLGENRVISSDRHLHNAQECTVQESRDTMDFKCRAK